MNQIGVLECHAVKRSNVGEAGLKSLSLTGVVIGAHP